MAFCNLARYEISFLAAASTRTADACGSNALLFNWSACVAFACCELATPKTLRGYLTFERSAPPRPRAMSSIRNTL